MTLVSSCHTQVQPVPASPLYPPFLALGEAGPLDV